MSDKCLGPIPEHLKKYEWYAPHQAWLRNRGDWHRDTGEARPRRADLSGAVLRRADLSGAVLRRAVLSGADLSGAVLRRADLSGAVLRRAVLSGADLSGAVLSDADLSGAVLRRAVLSGAVLRRAVLSGADLSGAVLSDADLSGADLSGAVLSDADGIPVIQNIDARILQAINGHPERMKMDIWHTCETTHCRAGWAITMAGEAGKRLEELQGPAGAGALIYAASRPDKPIPDFYCDDAAALADLQKCAAEDPIK